MLNVVDEKWRRSQIVDGHVKEALYLFLMQIHRDQMRHAGFGEHLGDEFGDDAAALLHLGLLRVGQIGYDADDVARARRLACVAHD